MRSSELEAGVWQLDDELSLIDKEGRARCLVYPSS